MAARTLNSEQIPVNVVGSSTFGRYNKISAEKTYNMFESDGWFVNFAGYKRRYELFENVGEGRGIFTSIRGNFLLAVINSQVTRFDLNLAPTTIGFLATSSGEVSIDENLNNQICIVDGVNAYIYNHGLPPNLTTQTLSGGLIPNYVAFHNTFFLLGNGDTTNNGSAWYTYSFASPTTITQSSQLALQVKPDYAKAVSRIPSQGGNVIVFGTAVAEIHTAQAGLLPYRRNNTISVDYGCLSASTIDECDEYVVWLGVNEKNSPAILVYSGQGISRISSDGIDYLLSTIAFPEQSTAMFARFDGHLVYQITFYNPLDNLTLMYDFNNKKFYHLSDENLDYHPARSYAYFNKKIYFVSLNNASLYEAGTDITVIDENIFPAVDPTKIHTIQRIRVCENLKRVNSDRFIVNRFSMTLEQGNDPNVTDVSLNNVIPIITESSFNPPETPLITEDGFLIVDSSSWGGAAAYVTPYQPRVDLSYSIDGAQTWSNTVSYPLNPVGKRKNIISWNGLGMCNYLTLKLRFWGLSSFVVNNGIVEIR